ncbi:MAG: AAA family ATPase [archaeon]|jgi:adenylate kinase
MKLIVTGTPGCGKTTLAKALGKKLNLQVINEKDFALQQGIGKFNDENELEIPIKEFGKKVNKFLIKNKNIILEGHVVCETKLKVDKVILLKVDPEELQMRLEQRNYSEQKIMDNVFCEGIDYCKKQIEKNYSKKKIILIQSKSSEKMTLALAQKALNV